jgi:hypothetical protein
MKKMEFQILDASINSEKQIEIMNRKQKQKQKRDNLRIASSS